MTPISRGLRTFYAGAAALLTSASVIEAIRNGDWKVGGTAVVLGLIAAALAGVVAWAQAEYGSIATSAWGRALRTFYQLLAGGVATLGVAELTKDELINFGQGLVRVVAVALVAGLGTFVLVKSEEGEVVVPPGE